jgi:O-antigen/teichoic acid export membrane protein
VLANVLTLGMGLALVSAVIASAGTLLFGDSATVMTAMAVAALSLPIMVVGTTYGCIFAVRLRMEYAAIAGVAQAVATLAAMIIVVVTGSGIVWLFVAYDLGVLVFVLVSLHFARRFVRPRFGFDSAYIRAIALDALPIGIGAGLTVAYDRIDLVLLQVLGSGVSVGYYSFAYRLIIMAVPLSFYLVGSVYPVIASYYAEGAWEAMRGLYQRCHDILTTAGMCAIIAAMVLAPVAVEIVGGSHFEPAVACVRILSLAVLPIWLLVLAEHTLVAFGRQNVMAWTAAAALVLNLSLNVMLIPLFGKEVPPWRHWRPKARYSRRRWCTSRA